MDIIKTEREEALDTKILSMLEGKPKKLMQLMIDDIEVRTIQEYANNVSIKRLGFNDHGPIHMRKSVLNALSIVLYLKEANIEFSLVKEKIGDREDSLCAILIASFMHDSGMTLTRSGHENTALVITHPIISRLLDVVYGDNNQKYIVRSLAMEAILGHMAITQIFSIEAGIVLVADGCDMEKGRASLPIYLSGLTGDGHVGKLGDVHKYSADAIDKVEIKKGKERAICIEVTMISSVGFFQIEEVLLQKINKSPIKKHIELIARFSDGHDYKQYL